MHTVLRTIAALSILFVQTSCNAEEKKQRYQPVIGTTWHWQLDGKINPKHQVDLYDIDLFNSPQRLIQQLQNTNRKVICYFSAGSAESWRPDIEQFPTKSLGKVVSGWPDERWVDIRSQKVRQIMKARIALAERKGCDGIEPDLMNGHEEDTGFNLLPEDQIKFNRFLAREAHSRGLAIGLKNDLSQIEELVDYFDFSVNEECHQYNECETLLPFIAAGKPVFNAEYKDEYIENKKTQDELCEKSRSYGFSTLILPLDLDDKFRISCLDR